MPRVVYASSGNDSFPLDVAIFIEFFISFHMSFLVLRPIAEMISKEEKNRVFWLLFSLRVAVLLFFDFFITPAIAIFDFWIAIFGMIIVSVIKKVRKSNIANNVNTVNQQVTNLTCPKCGIVLKATDKFCVNCGTSLVGVNPTLPIQAKNIVKPSDFDAIYDNTEDKMLEEFINREIVKAGFVNDKTLIPSDVLKRKNILGIIFAVLVFAYASAIFFHFPILTYLIGLIVLFIFYKITRKYDLMKYLKKEVKSRPNEKVSNIVMNVKNSLVHNSSWQVSGIGALVALVLPLIIFMNPHIMYEKIDGGYAVRYYTFGLTNFKTAVIPSSYKGEDVVSLRGNTFSNMFFLKTVTLPDTITEIRGQAFKNAFSLISVNIPKNLKYLGGGAFYNCKSLTSVVLPDTLTYMGGETFYGATKLESIKLSNNLTEIRGDTFSDCVSLKTITIPDKVTRIGGHAFYGNTSLTEVIFTSNSQLEEIGSSAFRMCSSLYSITLPQGVSINSRAFKESPTRIYYFNDYQDNSYNYWG